MSMALSGSFLSRGLLVALLALPVGACQTMTEKQADSPLRLEEQPDLPEIYADAPKSAMAPEVELSAIAEPASGPSPRNVELYPGSDRFLATSQKARNSSSSTNGTINLDFDSVPVAQAAGTILGDFLGVPYQVDAAVKGEVTLRTSQPVAREDLIPILESMLEAKGAVVTRGTDGLYRVAPRGAIKSRNLDFSNLGASDELPPGFGLRIVPLRYIGAAEMEKILKPLAAENTFVRVDGNRNLLILSGTRAELGNLLSVVSTFDVDWLKGMSVGMFELHQGDPSVVAGALTEVLGIEAEGPLQGMARIIPLKQLSSIMVVTPRKYLLDEVGKWVERLDRAGEGRETRFYVYPVQNSEAVYLANMLKQLITGETSSAQTASAEVAPGRQLRTLSSGSSGGATSSTNPAASADQSSAAIKVKGDGVVTTGPVQIVADERNNSLLIMASAADYQRIEAALERLDVTPMQVLVEASIIEVTLTDNLQYGLQWFFKNSISDYQGNGLLDLDAGSGLAANIPGFSYTLTDASGLVRVALNAFAKDSRLRVLSSPSVLVLDNRTAEIRVGNQQPVQTGTTTTDGGTQSTSIQYRDTGVTLAVTPRVNANGLVNMEIDQEVTDVGAVDSATGQRTFLQRRIKSSVAVNSGETIILGGLILDNSTRANSGLPVLHKLPLVGPLFGGVDDQSTRTELLVLITPRAISNRQDAQKAGEEMRLRMRNLSAEIDIPGRLGGVRTPAAVRAQ
ncbi:MAG: type II secretion system secretin GspD [Chromatiales bacterium]|nr:type II secretion system secretin GspD [Chromatiales bacterium]